MNNPNEFKGSNGKILYAYQIVDRLLSGFSSLPKSVDGDIRLDFSDSGNICYILNVSKSSNITINKGVEGQFQRMTLIIKNLNNDQVITLLSDLVFQGCKPFIKSSKGFTVVELMFDGYSTIYTQEIMSG